MGKYDDALTILNRVSRERVGSSYLDWFLGYSRTTSQSVDDPLQGHDTSGPDSDSPTVRLNNTTAVGQGVSESCMEAIIQTHTKSAVVDIMLEPLINCYARGCSEELIETLEGNFDQACKNNWDAYAKCILNLLCSSVEIGGEQLSCTINEHCPGGQT